MRVLHALMENNFPGEKVAAVESGLGSGQESGIIAKAIQKQVNFLQILSISMRKIFASSQLFGSVERL